MAAVIVGLIVGVNTFLALVFPSPITIACLAITVCMFIVTFAAQVLR